MWWAGRCENIKPAQLRKNVIADLVIIGGGYTGCSAALHAAERGASVCLLEAHRIGYGGSGRNVGLVNAGQWLSPDTIEKQMGKIAGVRFNSALMTTPDLVFSLIEKYGIECDLVRKGTLHCAHSSAGLADIKNRFRQYRKRGAPVTLIEKDELMYRTGTSSYLGALHDSRAGTIQPFAYCQGLARAAQSAGAVLYEKSPATNITRDGNDWIVHTTSGLVRAGALLLATNAYHQNADGAPSPHFVPVHYFQLATKPLRKSQLEVILPNGEGCWDTATIMSSFRLDSTGRLIVGGIGGLEHPGSGIHRNWARRKLAKLFPQLVKQSIAYSWSGRIAMTSDHIPKILRLGDQAFCIFGYSGRGIGPGTYFGSCVARVLTGESEECLPMTPVDEHSEHFVAVKHFIYEAGATLFHFAMGR